MESINVQSQNWGTVFRKSSLRSHSTHNGEDIEMLDHRSLQDSWRPDLQPVLRPSHVWSVLSNRSAQSMGRICLPVGPLGRMRVLSVKLGRKSSPSISHIGLSLCRRNGQPTTSLGTD